MFSFKWRRRLYILGFKIPPQQPLNSSLIRGEQVIVLLMPPPPPPPLPTGGAHLQKLRSGLRFHSQAQCQLVSLDLPVLVDVAVAQQDDSQLVQLRSRHVGLQWGGKK